MTETFHSGGLQFEVRRSDRRKTLSLTIDRAGELVVHVPTPTHAEELARWVNQKLLWVHRKLALKEELYQVYRRPEFVAGETFYYLGRSFHLRLVEKQDQPLEFDGFHFLLRRDACPGESHFQRWYTRNGEEWILKRVEFLSRRTGKEPCEVYVRDLGFRWGSCGRNGRLYFNWKLLQLPIRLADYVIAHELVHLRECHHGPEFWATLGRAMPDWQARKDDLALKARDYLVFAQAPTKMADREIDESDGCQGSEMRQRSVPES